ncbi:MAG: hypothetical protein PVG70_12005 [Desulfobacterales bacterium]
MSTRNRLFVPAIINDKEGQWDILYFLLFAILCTLVEGAPASPAAGNDKIRRVILLGGGVQGKKLSLASAASSRPNVGGSNKEDGVTSASPQGKINET